MDTNTSELKADIARTRMELGETLDALGQKISPKAAIRRKTFRAKRSMRGVLDKMMGAEEQMMERAADLGTGIGEKAGGIRQTIGEKASGIGGSVSEMGHNVTERASDLGRKATEVPRGNPMAAALVALGAGALAGSLIKPRRKEKEMAQALFQHAEPLKREMADAGKALAEGVKDAAVQSADEVKIRLSDAANTVTEDAKSRGEQLKEEATVAGEQVKDRIAH